jgi:excisionase family DNA binding protein
MNTITVLLTEADREDIACRVAAKLAPPSEPLTFAQVAKLIGVSEKTISLRVAAGQIRRVPHCSRRLIPRSEVNRLLQ